MQTQLDAFKFIIIIIYIQTRIHLNKKKTFDLSRENRRDSSDNAKKFESSLGSVVRGISRYHLRVPSAHVSL